MGRVSDERKDCFKNFFLEMCADDEEGKQIDDDVQWNVILLLNIS